MENTNQTPNANGYTTITDPAQIINLMESAFITPEPTPEPAPAPASTPAPIPTPAEASLELLFQTIMNLATPYIERAVHAKFTEMVDNSLALTKLDADIEQRMREIASEIAEEIADEKIYNHERNEDHFNDDYIDDKVAEALRGNDLTERRIEEMISDAIDNHTNDTEHHDEGDIEHIVDQFTETNDFLTKHNIGENLDLEDKVRDALRGMTFDITPRY